MEFQIAVAKVNKYATFESGDTLEVVERPNGGLSVVFAKDLNNTIKTKSAPVPHKPASNHPWRTSALPASRKSRDVPAACGGDISTLEFR